MNPIFVDTNVPIYASGRPHPLREPCRRIIHAIGQRQLDVVTSVEVFQELLHRALRLGRLEDGLALFDHFHRIMEGRILSLTETALLHVRSSTDSNPDLNARDHFHLAVMQEHGLNTILSAGTHFDGIPTINRLDPQNVRL